MRLSYFLSLFYSFLLFGNHAFAQCVSAIPGVPAGAGVPCYNEIPANITEASPYDPNAGPDPSDPSDPGAPNAAKHDRDSCDADFMNQIYAKSFLEANRETMISKYLVVKPDSVLEYACFDQSVKRTAEIAGPIFTEAPNWSSTSVSNPFGGSIPLRVFMGETKLDTTLDGLVMSSLNDFVNTNNFTHTFMGGTQSDDDTVAATVQAAQNTCTFMNGMHTLAKCDNVNPNLFFMDFESLTVIDPRNIPTNAGECTINPITQQLINVADNRAGRYALKYQDRVGNTTRFDTYLDYVIVDRDSDCMPPIKTGVTVVRESHDTQGGVEDTFNIEDSVCSNPGCFFDGENSCLKVPQ